MSSGKTISAEIKEALNECMELRMMASVSPFGPLERIDHKISNIENCLKVILGLITETVHVDYCN